MRSPITVTLDTNCIVDIDEGREGAPFTRSLVAAHADGRAVVHVIAIMASEKQRSGGHLSDFAEFTARLCHLGLDHLPHVLPLLCLDVSYWGHCLFASSEDVDLDAEIHAILFPEVPLTYPENASDADKVKWRNAKCDVQALWSHIHAGNDVFVSRDRNFHKATKLPKLLALGAGQILTPEGAAKLLS